MDTPADLHVAVVAFPFGTHAAPLLAVIRRLSAASPATLFSFLNTQNSNRSLSFLPYDSNMIRLRDVSNGVPEGYVFSGKPQEEFELFMRAAPASFRAEMKAAEAETGRRVTCLVTDAFCWFGAEMAEEMGVPWVAFWVGGPMSLSAHLHTDLIRQKLKDTTAEGAREMDQTLEFVPGMSKVRVRDLPEGVVFGNLESFFSVMLHRMGRALPAAAAFFLNSFEELDPVTTRDLKSKLRNFLSVGPTNLIQKPLTSGGPDSTGCLQWLETQRAASVAYIGFGSLMVPPRGELVALAEALETSGAPFIWSLRREVWERDLPEGFVERTRDRGQGMVVPWTPQEGILRHAAVGVFVTHCGWNSLLESIAGGVPMICRPFFGDQRLNARVIEAVLGIGMVVGAELNKEGVVRSLDVILRGKEGTKMREKMRVLGELAVSAIGPQRTSTRNFELLCSTCCRLR